MTSEKQTFLALTITALAFFTANQALAQTAAQREDARLREEQLLRANEQTSLLIQRLEKAETRIAELETRLAAAQNAQRAADARITQLDSRITQLDSRVTREREALLDEVANILADTSTRPGGSAPILRQPAPGGARPASQSAQQVVQESGFEYIVKPGDTLSSIVRFLNAQGVRTSIAEISKANNISDPTRIRVGQKLFIPRR